MLSYSIDDDNNLIRTKAEGKISIFELNRHMDKVVNDEKYRKGMNTIVDLNDAFLKMTFDDLPIINSIIRKHEKIRSASKWAVFVKSNTIRALINFVVPVLTMNKIKLRVFDNEKNAMVWIES